MQSGLHAVAVDEQREDFRPTLWDDDPRITQALFPGAHSDVGGGNGIADNESGLSDWSLRWMIDRLAPLGVVFAHPLAWVPQPDARGTAHQPWLDPPWNLLPHGPRHFPAGLCVAQSLVDRLAAGPVAFAAGVPATAVYSRQSRRLHVGHETGRRRPRGVTGRHPDGMIETPAARDPRCSAPHGPAGARPRTRAANA